MYRFNDSLIERTQDRSFFDPIAFRILRFNEAGYRLITQLKSSAKSPAKPSEFSATEYLAIADQAFHDKDEALAFLERCAAHRLFVPATSHSPSPRDAD